MKKIAIISLLLISYNILYGLTEAVMEEKDIFEFEMKLYTVRELKELFPTLELESTSSWDDFNSYNYLFGWIRIKMGARSFPKNQSVFSLPVSPAAACKIKVWNRFFNYSFVVAGIGEEKSYFLIPMGKIYIGDRDFQYSITIY